MNKKPQMSGLTLAFVLFLNFFFFHQTGPVMTLLIFTGAIVYFFLLLRGNEKKKVLPGVLGFSGLLLITRFARIWTSNQTISTLLFVSTLALLALVVYTLGMGQTVRSLWEVIAVPVRIIGGYIHGGLLGFFSIFRFHPTTHNKGIGSWPIIRTVGIGSLLAIPVLAILISLLEGADPIFAYHMKRLFSWNIFWEIPARLWWSILLFILLNPFRFFHLEDRVRSSFSFVGRLGWHRELTVVIALVAVTVAGFLVVQWPYVFANVPAETDLTKFGVATYSEYVQKGFGELLRVAALLYAIVWIGLLTTRENVKKAIGLLPMFQWIVMGELMMFVLSIFRRIWLYQLHHGWTLVRIYGGVFLLWLTGMIVFLALRHVIRKRLVTGELVMTAGIILALGFFNVEHFIAATHPPTVNKRVDYVYLSGMSPDGYAGWKMSYDWASEVLTKRNLDTKDFLDAFDRRDIAYAGVIVHRLSRQYHRLVLQHGSREEQLTYAEKLLSFHKSLEIDVGTLETWLGKLADRSLDPSVAIRAFGFRYDTSYALPLADNSSMYVFWPERKFSSYDTLDRMFVWNVSSVRAYNRIKSDIPFDQLLLMQRVFMSLGKRIEKQPMIERDYPVDVSFRAPFLDTP